MKIYKINARAYVSLHVRVFRWNKKLVFLHDPHDQDFSYMTNHQISHDLSSRFHITGKFYVSIVYIRTSKYLLHDPHDQIFSIN